MDRKEIFNEKRDGLEIYKKIKAESNISFTVGEMEKCLKTLCSSRHVLLEKDSIDGVLKYWRE